MIKTLQQRPQSKSYRSRLSQARPITRQNDLDQAQKCFQMGKEHYARNEIEKAEKFYLEAVVHNPAHYKSYCNLGLCYKVRGQYPNSIQAYKQSLGINPLDAITNYNLANVYRLIGNQERSISHYMIVIDLKEKQGVDVGTLCLDSYNNLGICYKNIENYTQAIQCFNKILKEKPSEEFVKFNLGVCYLKVIRRMLKNPKTQNSMVVKQHIVKTIGLFQQVIKNQPKNQVATLALIELNSVSNPENQNLKKYIAELDELIKRPESSGFVKNQGAKVREYCVNMLAKLQKNAQENRKAQQKKKQEEQKKLAQEKQKQKAEREKQQQEAKKRAAEIEKANSAKVTQPTPQPQKVSTVPVPQINAKQVFEAMASSLFEKLQTIIEDPEKLSKEKSLTQVLSAIIDSLQKQHLSANKDKKLAERIKKQLGIIGCSILGENLIEKEFFNEAFDIYYGYFLERNLKTQINKNTLFLETHRAIASVLTNLGQSQKAIEHYQIISQEFNEKNIKDKDPLQELHSGLAVNYESQGLHEKAIQEFEEAIKLNPSNYIFYYNLGYCQHCAGKDKQAIKSYNKFLQEINKETVLESGSKQSYILQAMISIFICLEGSIDQKMKKCNEIEEKIAEFCGDEPERVLAIIDHKSLMHYYLLACDLHEQIIFDLQKNSKQVTKANKEKLFAIYINLLELPNCPDRDQILINCGNLLFEEREFFGALQFYEKVSRSKTEVFNIIALTLMNVNEHERALNSIQVAIQSDKNNKIYEVNYEIMKWAYGLEVTSKDNLLWVKYPCSCDLEFDSRVQYSKSLIIKLTAIIEQEISTKSNTQNLTIQSIFNKLLSDKQDPKLWKDQEPLQKYNTQKSFVQNHCQAVHKNKEQISIDKKLIKELLETIVNHTETSAETVNKILAVFGEKLNNPNTKQSSDYLNVLEQSLALFIYQNSKDASGLKKLKEVLESKTPVIKNYEIIFPDPVTPNSSVYPSKNYTVVYPSIELKLENLIHSLLAWSTQLQDKFIYLLKIVEAVAYKSQLRSPSLADYNFACCKYVQNCEKCFKKASYVMSKIFNIDCKENFNTLKDDSSLAARKKATFTAFVNKFGKNLEALLTPAPGKDNKTLSIKLSDQTLPMQMQLNFSSQAQFEKFLKAFCAEVSVKEPAYDKNDNQVYLTINKLIRIRCAWKEIDFIEQFVNTVTKATLGLNDSAIEFFDGRLLKQWSEDEGIKPLLSKIVDLSSFLS